MSEKQASAPVLRVGLTLDHAIALHARQQPGGIASTVFMCGKLKVKGDIGLAMKLGQVLAV